MCWVCFVAHILSLVFDPVDLMFIYAWQGWDDALVLVKASQAHTCFGLTLGLSGRATVWSLDFDPLVFAFLAYIPNEVCFRPVAAVCEKSRRQNCGCPHVSPCCLPRVVAS